MRDHYVDARRILADDKSPLDLVLAQAKRVEQGGVLIVDAPFDPVPLRDRLGPMGFRSTVEKRGDGHWRVRFVKSTRKGRTATGFLGGAKGRLLPASVPFRFFVTAAVFHVAAWIGIILGADDLPGYTGGLGWPVAAVHLLTLGVLVMTAVGASLQLLPVSTRQSIIAAWPAKLIYWLLLAGVTIFTAAAALHQPAGLAVGGSLAGAGLAVYCVVLGDNLRRARDLPVITAHAWAALAALIVLVLAGLGSAFDYVGQILPDHGAVASAHMIAAGGGFMGMLIIGFSHVLLPMFTLSGQAPPKLTWGVLALASVALIAGLVGAILALPSALAAAAVIALIASSLHTWSMETLFRHRMRKRLGLSFLVIRAGGALLPVSLLVGLAVMLDVAIPNGPTLFIVLLLVGWQLTFLIGILQRVMPFLGSMHVPVQANQPSLVSRFSDTLPLKLWAVCHAAALSGLCLGVATDAADIVRSAGIFGVAGSVCFLTFTGQIVARVFARGND
jgi:hypothetical protein